MPTRRQKKEEEILEFIEKNVDKDNWFALTRSNIVKKFKGSGFSEKDVEEILDDLESNGFDEGQIEEKEIDLKILCLTELSKKVDQKLEGNIRDEKYPFYIFSAFLIIFLFYKIEAVYNLFYKSYFNIPKNNVLSISVWGALIYFFGSWAIGNVCYKFAKKSKKLRPILKEYSWVGYPYVAIFVLIFVLYYFMGLSKDALVTLLLNGVGIAGTIVTTIIGLIRHRNKVRKRK